MTLRLSIFERYSVVQTLLGDCCVDILWYRCLWASEKHSTLKQSHLERVLSQENIPCQVYFCSVSLWSIADSSSAQSDKCLLEHIIFFFRRRNSKIFPRVFELSCCPGSCQSAARLHRHGVAEKSCCSSHPGHGAGEVLGTSRAFSFSNLCFYCKFVACLGGSRAVKWPSFEKQTKTNSAFHPQRWIWKRSRASSAQCSVQLQQLLQGPSLTLLSLMLLFIFVRKLEQELISLSPVRGWPASWPGSQPVSILFLGNSQ